jgi:hypothetical protein
LVFFFDFDLRDGGEKKVAHCRLQTGASIRDFMQALYLTAALDEPRET